MVNKIESYRFIFVLTACLFFTFTKGASVNKTFPIHDHLDSGAIIKLSVAVTNEDPTSGSLCVFCWSGAGGNKQMKCFTDDTNAGVLSWEFEPKDVTVYWCTARWGLVFLNKFPVFGETVPRRRNIWIIDDKGKRRVRENDQSTEDFSSPWSESVPIVPVRREVNVEKKKVARRSLKVSSTEGRAKVEARTDWTTEEEWETTSWDWETTTDGWEWETTTEAWEDTTAPEPEPTTEPEPEPTTEDWYTTTQEPETTTEGWEETTWETTTEQEYTTTPEPEITTEDWDPTTEQEYTTTPEPEITTEDWEPTTEDWYTTTEQQTEWPTDWTTPGYEFVCPAPSGNFPDPFDCAGFYSCDNGVVVGHQFCPDGLYFNPVINNCDFPWNVDCPIPP